MKKKLILGLLIGAILVYLSIRGIRFQDVMDGFRMVRYEYVFPLRMSAALGTIFVERIFDSFTMLFIFISILFFIPFPTWLIRASLIFFWSLQWSLLS